MICFKIDFDPSNTVKSIDFDRYIGKWWGLAKYPIMWEKSCDKATADYDYVDGILKVTNNCIKGNQVLFSRTGEAYVPDATDMGKLKLNFTDRLPSDGESDYWIHW